MKVRRIVTGHNSEGKAVFVSDGSPETIVEFQHVPSQSATLLWETDSDARIGPKVSGRTTVSESWMPAPGSTNAMIIVFPPDSVMTSADFDPMAAGHEFMQKMPGLAERFEPTSPGMHKTETIDYGIVLDGEIYLELDDGQMRKLQTHDIVVQNGTRHAWRNRSDKPVPILFVMIGASREV